MNKLRQEKGITLIALVITIIVLLILAGITLSTLAGRRGIIKQAQNAETEHNKAAAIEEVNLVTMQSLDKRGEVDTTKLREELTNIGASILSEEEGIWIVQYKGTNIAIDILEADVIEYTGELPKLPIQPGEVAVGNQEYNDGTTTVTIPNGFKVSEKTSEQKVETGLVVIDSKQNEWVWVPVEDIREWVIEAPNTAIPGTNVTATTNRYSQLYDFTSSGKTKRTVAALGSSGYTDYREPDILTGASNGTGSGYDAANYNTVLSRYTNDEYCTSLDMLAKQYAKDYNDMIESISRYHGFYIGRYELTGTIENPTEKAGVPITSQDWYNLYNACGKFSTNEVVSTMIWGTQWDMTMEFVSTKGDKKPVDSTNTSESWGNYPNVDIYNSEGTSIIKASGTGSRLDTGITTFTMANNIYDLAGNFYEWTQEAWRMGARVVRGNYYNSSNAASRCAEIRGYHTLTNSLDSLSSRATLYLKTE